MNKRQLFIASLIITAGAIGSIAIGDDHAKSNDHGKAAPAAAPAKTPAPAKITTEPKPATKETTKTNTTTKAEPKTEAKPAKNEKPVPAAEPETFDADAALNFLTEGNQRWVDGKTTDPNISTDRRGNVAENGQKPFVTVLTCADSRLPVERLFDRGVGEVFVVRVAGNISGTSEVGTIEYGVGHLNTPLLVVMGHSKCGAVAAAASGAQVHGSIKHLVDHVQPAVDRARKNNPNAEGAELINLAIKENVWQSIFDLYKTSPEIRSMVESGKVRVVGAVCDVATGKVTFMGSHPWQAELLQAMKNSPENKTQTAGADDAKAGH